MIVNNTILLDKHTIYKLYILSNSNLGPTVYCSKTFSSQTDWDWSESDDTIKSEYRQR